MAEEDRPWEGPAGYADWLADLKERIRQARLRASLAVNHELVLLYWQVGTEILERQNRRGWGAPVIDRLAADLRHEFPGVAGWSARNLKYMRALAAAWPDRDFVQGVLAQLPWWHQIALLEKVDDPEARRWYARAAIQHGWSRNVLVHQIEGRLHLRQGGDELPAHPAGRPVRPGGVAHPSRRRPRSLAVGGVGETAVMRVVEEPCRITRH